MIYVDLMLDLYQSNLMEFFNDHSLLIRGTLKLGCISNL